MNLRRMRSGLIGRMLSTAGDVIAVQYSLDRERSVGRLRPLDPEATFPKWIHQGMHAKLVGSDNQVIDVAILLIKERRAGWKDDDYFAEFVVRVVTH